MLSFIPRDVLDEIWDLIESVSEGFPSYSSILSKQTEIVSTLSPDFIVLVFLMWTAEAHQTEIEIIQAK